MTGSTAMCRRMEALQRQFAKTSAPLQTAVSAAQLKATSYFQSFFFACFRKRLHKAVSAVQLDATTFFKNFPILY